MLAQGRGLIMWEGGAQARGRRPCLAAGMRVAGSGAHTFLRLSCQQAASSAHTPAYKTAHHVAPAASALLVSVAPVLHSVLCLCSCRPPPTTPRRLPPCASAAYPAPGLCQVVFNAEQNSRSGCIAKAAVYLLGRGSGTGSGAADAAVADADPRDDPGEPAAAACQRAVAGHAATPPPSARRRLAAADCCHFAACRCNDSRCAHALVSPYLAVYCHLEAVVNLLEQYYHPSNSGRWAAPSPLPLWLSRTLPPQSVPARKNSQPLAGQGSPSLLHRLATASA